MQSVRAAHTPERVWRLLWRLSLKCRYKANMLLPSSWQQENLCPESPISTLTLLCGLPEDICAQLFLRELPAQPRWGQLTLRKQAREK